MLQKNNAGLVKRLRSFVFIKHTVVATEEEACQRFSQIGATNNKNVGARSRDEVAESTIYIEQR